MRNPMVKIFFGLWYDTILDKGSAKMNYMQKNWPSRLVKQQRQLGDDSKQMKTNKSQQRDRGQGPLHHNCCVGMIFLSQCCSYMLPLLIERCCIIRHNSLSLFHSSRFSMESFFVDVGLTAFAVLGSRWHCRRQQEQNEILLILKQACVSILKIH